MTEGLYWVAHYQDGSYISQYNENGTENKYADIKRDVLCFFDIFLKHEKLPQPTLILRYHFDTPEKELIFRRRVYINQATNERMTIVLVGWQINVNGKNIQSVSVIFPDGRTEVIGKWTEGDQFFDPPIRHENEGETIVGIPAKDNS